MIKFEWIDTGDYTQECHILGGFIKLHVFETMSKTWMFWMQGNSARNYKSADHIYQSCEEAKKAVEEEFGIVLFDLLKGYYFSRD